MCVALGGDQQQFDLVVQFTQDFVAVVAVAPAFDLLEPVA